MFTTHRTALTDVVNVVKIPIGSKVTHTDMSIDNGVESISIWYECETDNALEERKFVVFGTGADMSHMHGYNPQRIGTVIKSNRYAFHVYEVDAEY